MKKLILAAAVVAVAPSAHADVITLEYTKENKPIIFFQNGCPENGWEFLKGSKGRYLVSFKKPEEKPKDRVVGKPIKKGEARAAGEHSHGYLNAFTDAGAHNKNMGGGYAELSINNPKQTQSLSPSNSNEINVKDASIGTVAPYIMVSACVPS